MKICQQHLRAALVPVALVATILAVSPASAQFNQEIMMKWMDVTVIHYAITGDYEGEVFVVNSGTNGMATVKDHVEISFDYDVSADRMVGVPTFTDSATQMGALRNGADGCRPPTITGKYEHSTIESMVEGGGGQFTMMVRTDYPAAQMTVACSGGNEPVAAHSTTEPQELGAPGIMILAMGDTLTGDDLRVSKDASYFIVKKDGWTYTITPTKVR